MINAHIYALAASEHARQAIDLLAALVTGGHVATAGLDLLGDAVEELHEAVFSAERVADGVAGQASAM